MATRETDRPLLRFIGQRASGQLRYPQNLHHSAGHDPLMQAPASAETGRSGRSNPPVGCAPIVAAQRHIFSAQKRSFVRIGRTQSMREKLHDVRRPIAAIHLEMNERRLSSRPSFGRYGRNVGVSGREPMACQIRRKTNRTWCTRREAAVSHHHIPCPKIGSRTVHPS